MRFLLLIGKLILIEISFTLWKPGFTAKVLFQAPLSFSSKSSELRGFIFVYHNRILCNALGDLNVSKYVHSHGHKLILLPLLLFYGLKNKNTYKEAP